MAVVLRREELILRRKGAVDLAHVQLPPIDAGSGEGLRQIRERHQDFALCQGWKHKLRHSQDPETGDGQAALQQIATRMCCVHGAVSLPALSVVEGRTKSHITTGRDLGTMSTIPSVPPRIRNPRVATGSARYG